MRKQTIQYTSPLDALVTVAKTIESLRKSAAWTQRRFFDQYSRGQLSDDTLFVEWANDYRHYLALRRELEERLLDVA